MPIVMPMEVKFCEDCRFYRQRGTNRPLCGHPLASIENVVSRVNAGAFCESTRMTACGREAKLFEPKPIVEKTREPVRKQSWFSMFRRGTDNG